MMACATLFMLYNSIWLIADARRGYVQTHTYYTTQLEYEAMQLVDHLDRLRHDDPDTDFDNVSIWFDILWSRVNTRLDRAGWPGETRLLPGVEKVFATTRDVLTEIEPLILAVEGGDTSGIAQAARRLRDVVRMSHDTALRARSASAQQDAQRLRDQARQAYLTLAFLAGTALFGILSIAMIGADRRHIGKLNRSLEDRVRARTEELEATNAKLAAEAGRRKAAQAAAEERETRLAQAAQLAKLGYYIRDVVENRCEFCSDQHAAVHGLTPEQFVARTKGPDGALILVHPDDREDVRKNNRRIRAGEPVAMDYRVETPAGMAWVREIVRPVRDEAGRVVKEIGSSLDITQQHETELKLAEAQRMDSIGKLTGGIAHDFNNLLAVILGNLEILREVPDSCERSEIIGDAIDAALRGRDLTLNMLSFARRAPLDPKRLSLNQVVSEMRTLLRRTLPSNIDLILELSDDAKDISADRSLTDSALLNLAINARDAMPEGGKLVMRTGNRTIGRDDPAAEHELAPGEYATLSVSDTGHGIPVADQARVFEPFFTTKTPGRNSGLGLSMVQGFIQQTGGAVEVRSQPGQGTTITLYFRTASSTALPPRKSAAAGAIVAGQGLRVLLVEDDADVRKTLTRQLQQIGMSVIKADNGAAALRAFATAGPFDLLVSDIVMPGPLQGPALLRRLRRWQPDLPAIFLSGYPKGASPQIDKLTRGETLLLKPVSHVALAEAVLRHVKQTCTAD